MWTRAELKMRGKGAFYKNYWHCVATALVMTIFSGIASKQVHHYIERSDYNLYYDSFFEGLGYPHMGIFFNLLGLQMILLFAGLIFLAVKVFLGNPLVVGGCRFFIKNQTTNPYISEIGYGVRPQGYSNIVLVMFLKNLFTSLWTLLLVVPGIIKHYEYLMIPYILAENPNMNREEAFLISKRMMTGQKMNAFLLDLSFIGWRIVEVLTFGIAGLFFVNPYYQTTMAELYTVNRTIAYQQGYIR